MEYHNLPTGAAFFQLGLEPVALGKQVRQLTVAVEQEKLYRTIAECIDLIVGNL